MTSTMHTNIESDGLLYPFLANLPPKPRHGSIQDAWLPGHVLYKAISSSKLYLQPDEGGYACGSIAKGSFYAALETIEGVDSYQIVSCSSDGNDDELRRADGGLGKGRRT